MKNIIFSPTAWGEYLDLQEKDKKLQKRVNMLIKEILRDPYNGIGKGEKLKFLDGDVYSRRVDEKTG